MVEHGFQASETHHQGAMVNRPDTCPGDLTGSVPHMEWDFAVEAVSGWGDDAGPQRATAGWLATLPVFEPHWQVLVSHGLASGWVQWGDRPRWEFDKLPFYSEKNWGSTFPRRWAWLQCNSFAGSPGLALTGALALRDVLGTQEEVGIIGVQFRGELIEVSPASGRFTWDVDPWGSWKMSGRNSKYEVSIEATCAPNAGTPLRAPTGPTGLIPACKDTFEGARHLWLDASRHLRARFVTR